MKAVIYGIVGRNGLGKTVLLKLISGIMKTTGGYVEVDVKIVGKDMDFVEDMRMIIEEPGFLLSYSWFRNLKMIANIRNKVKDDEIKEY